MNLLDIADRNQMVSAEKTQYRSPRVVELVVEFSRPGGTERHIGRFDESHTSIARDAYYDAVRGRAVRVFQSINDFRRDAAFQNAIFRNRLVRVDREFPLLSDGDVAAWNYLVVGLRRRRKQGGPDTPSEQASLERLRVRALSEIDKLGCEPEAMVHHRNGPWEILFRNPGGLLSRPIAERLLDTLEQRCREPNVELDTSRRNAAAMIRLPITGRIYVAI